MDWYHFKRLRSCKNKTKLTCEELFCKLLLLQVEQLSGIKYLHTADMSMILSTSMKAVNAPNENEISVKHITSIFKLK